MSWEEGLKETIDWYTKNGQASGYCVPSGALVAHPTGGKPQLEGEVYQSLEEMMAAQERERAAEREEGKGEKKPMFLVYGRTGWIGGKLGKLLTELGHDWCYGSARLQDRVRPG